MRKSKLQTMELNKVRVEDSFWNKYTRLVTKEIIPYQWKALNDAIPDAEKSHCMENFRVAAKETEGTFEGFVFQDTDLAKWLEAVAYSLSYEPNPKLEEVADEAIELVGRAQEENGYLDTYFSILYPGRQFCNLKEGHELYTAGHFMEAAVAYYKVTGKRRLLEIMEKEADLICQVFHTKEYENAVPGHEEVELALVKMAEVTGKNKYLQMAKDFVERRGCEPNYLRHEHEKETYIDVWHDANMYRDAYGQNHLPVREQKTAEGHAVRAVYLYSGMADVAYGYGDESLFGACEALYNNIVEKRMYLTGGIGSSGILERFTTDYDLPNDRNYSESCASIGLAMFCRRMAQITGDAKYVDTMERALMNTVLSGIAMDGKSFFYVNPLEVWPDNCMDGTSLEHVKPVRQKWFGCACCPPNIARTLASLGEYLAFTGENELWINLLVGGRLEVTLSEKQVRVKMESQFPWEGSYDLSFDGEEAAEGTLYLRIPEYGQNPRITIDGESIAYTVEKGYAVLRQPWKNQKVSLRFDMPAQFVRANPRVRADIGKVAVVKGPLVYCLEQQDNGENLPGIWVDTKEPLQETFDSELLGGVVKITAKGKRIQEQEWTGRKLYGTGKVSWKETTLTLVPYANWGNRIPGEMLVWMKELH